ncbi:hypothetical protein RHMOL_Rhmol01G0270200 [Rhododendron molle]|uniref:Uncharacterized protein n=1 Tax=Rhododendron molle TaxID=49168 RepID=A0ACC0Q7A6_RHOML|nr:hypothetical protein RHMOL_Rhmol01G0270200 [Rhododendron molle]
MASDPATRAKVTNTFQQASKEGMNIARTWAFSDGGSDRPLQSSPGTCNPHTFQVTHYKRTRGGVLRHRVMYTWTVDLDNQ